MSLPFARYEGIVDDWEAFQTVIKRPLPTTIWANPLRIQPQTLVALLPELALEALSWVDDGFRVTGDVVAGLHWAYLAGLFHIQEEVSMLPIHFLDVQPGERVLDMCAAPGNKTAQLAAVMQNRGTLVANDRSTGRLRAARNTLQRLGVLNVTMMAQDATSLPKKMGLFDKILVDAPCSCEGTCRKDPSFLQPGTRTAWQKLVGTQTALLRKAVQLCRPGGRIVYATCTFAPEENECVVDEVLQRFGDQVRVLPTEMAGLRSGPGLVTWNGRSLHPSLHHAMRIWPHHNDTGGFFVAVLEKDATVDRGVEAVEPRWSYVEEREPWQEMLSERFGIEATRWADYRLFRFNKRGVHLINGDHGETAVELETLGMFFIRADSKYPKLTTAAAMHFGRWATQNMIELDANQLRAFVAREGLVVRDDQTRMCTGTGYVMVRYRGYTLGVGVYYAHRNFVENMYPKGWVRHNIVT